MGAESKLALSSLKKMHYNKKLLGRRQVGKARGFDLRIPRFES